MFRYETGYDTIVRFLYLNDEKRGYITNGFKKRGVVLRLFKLNITLKQKLIIASIAIPIMIFFGGMMGIFDSFYVHSKTNDVTITNNLLDQSYELNQYLLESKVILEKAKTTTDKQTLDLLKKDFSAITKQFRDTAQDMIDEPQSEDAVFFLIVKLPALDISDVKQETKTLLSVYDRKVSPYEKDFTNHEALVLGLAEVEKEHKKLHATLQETVETAKQAEKDTFKFVWWQLFFMIGFAMILVGGYALYFTYSIVNPLYRLEKKAEIVSQGDLTSNVENSLIHREDEIGRLSTSINNTIINLRTVLASAGANAQATASTAEELSASSEEVSATTSSVNRTVNDISNKNNELFKLIEQTQNQTQDLVVSIKEVTNSINESSETAKAVNQDTNKAANAAKGIGEKMNVLEGSVAESTKLMEELSQKTHEINKVVEFINSIAEQTNLLALNAAIEAARAGDAGRGFAVVADEVRKLAEESQKATKQIELTISEVMKSADKTLEAMKRGNNAVSSSTDAITDSLSTLGAISAKMNDLNSKIEMIKGAAEEELKISAEVSAAFELVTASSKETAKNTKEASSMISETTESINQVANGAQLLAKNSQDLNSTISQFKF